MISLHAEDFCLLSTTVINILGTGLTVGLAFTRLQYQDALNYPPAKIYRFNFFLSIKGREKSEFHCLAMNLYPFFKGTDKIETKMW